MFVQLWLGFLSALVCTYTFCGLVAIQGWPQSCTHCPQGTAGLAMGRHVLSLRGSWSHRVGMTSCSVLTFSIACPGTNTKNTRKGTKIIGERVW